MIIIPTILESFASLKDGTLKLVFSTNELTPEQLTGVAQNTQKFGFLAFKQDDFKQKEVDLLDNLESDFESKGKSKSQRLRNVLYRSWEQDNLGYDDFQLYYNFRLEKLITYLKDKLD